MSHASKWTEDGRSRPSSRLEPLFGRRRRLNIFVHSPRGAFTLDHSECRDVHIPRRQNGWLDGMQSHDNYKRRMWRA